MKYIEKTTCNVSITSNWQTYKQVQLLMDGYLIDKP